MLSLPHKIDITITSYNISFTNLVSDEICDSVTIPASSCADGACNHVFILSSSSCPNDTDISIIVSASDSDSHESSRPSKIGLLIIFHDCFPAILKQYIVHVIIIDAENNFIEPFFDKETSSFSLKFLHQPKESDKFYSVQYGSFISSCDYLPYQEKGHLSHSDSTTIDLESIIGQEDTIFCMSAIVRNRSTNVSMEGTYTFGE